MTQIFSSPSTSTLTSSDRQTEKSSDKRTFTGVSLSTNKQVQGSNNHVSQKIKNFFRINSANTGGAKSKDKDKDQKRDSIPTPTKLDLKATLRQSRFIPHIGSRSRTNTIVSEGNPLDDSMSPTAHANPYFQYQGPPQLRHHNDNSVPPSPPDGADSSQNVNGVKDSPEEQAMSGKEELARKLRRVASAPNAQGLLGPPKPGERPPSQLGAEEGLGQHSNASTLSVVGTASEGGLLGVPTTGIPSTGQIRNSLAFRRTYSSNAIKVRNVEVSPSSFEKVKMIGKGDVGKVYLVKEYKSQRLYAMKGKPGLTIFELTGRY